jgi:hypothetical protein
MNKLWVLTLGLVALTVVQGCKRKEPEPIPGPKAGLGMVAFAHPPPGIAWFQGSLDEAFARTEMHLNCRDRALMAPRATEMMRARKRLNTPAPVACPADSCPPGPGPHPRHRLV